MNLALCRLNCRRAAALLARGGRLPSDRRLARPSRSANSGARAVACGRKLNAREPAGLRGRVLRRGARSYAAAHASCALEALQATHGARYGREAHGTQQTPTGTRLPTRSAPRRPRSLHRRRQRSGESQSRVNDVDDSCGGGAGSPFCGSQAHLPPLPTAPAVREKTLPRLGFTRLLIRIIRSSLPTGLIGKCSDSNRA